jgi:small-conductance mechanosensitive channel
MGAFSMTSFNEWIPVLVAFGVGAASLLVGAWAARWAMRRATRFAGGMSAVFASLRRPLNVWVTVLSVSLAFHLVELPQRISVLVDGTVVAVLILSVTLWLADVAVRLLLLGATRTEPPLAVPGVVQHLARFGVVAVGGMVLLNTLGVSITPLLTTIGIGGLAIALGLQETLANVFAGIQITLAHNIRVGDFLRLESGEEGTVEDINWRTTRVRQLPNTVVLVPNGRLAQSIVTNYDLPTKDLAVLMQVGVHYASDLERVERVTIEVATEVMKTVPGGIAEFTPFIRYHTFGESSIDFTVILRARQFGDNFLIKHEFIKRLVRRYAQERIVIPFPIRAVNLAQEGADRQLGWSR